jgi:hypothetical protein
LLKAGNSSIRDCHVAGGTDPGLVHISCANNGSSDAVLTTGITVTVENSFVGKVVSDDTENTSDTNGAAGFPVVTTDFDWSHFDNAYRSWGKDGSVDFPNDDQRDRWTTGGGRIWDWSLSAGDSVLRETLPLPDGNMTLTQSWNIGAATPTTDSECNSIVAGSIHNGGACETTYLLNAVEIPGDDIGNDDALCVSGEACLYAPNIGSYQGHGNLISAGAFTPGTLTGITLMRLSDNGR